MEGLINLLNQPKNRKNAVIMALVGAILALPIPVAGIHKFYLGQPLWGIIYLLLWHTPIPRIACVIDAVWYLMQDSDQFNLRFNGELSSSGVTVEPSQVSAIATALRELDQLRTDGLMSEYEFEQKRRQLLDRIN